MKHRGANARCCNCAYTLGRHPVIRAEHRKDWKPSPEGREFKSGFDAFGFFASACFQHDFVFKRPYYVVSEYLPFMTHFQGVLMGTLDTKSCWLHSIWKTSKCHCRLCKTLQGTAMQQHASLISASALKRRYTLRWTTLHGWPRLEGCRLGSVLTGSVLRAPYLRQQFVFSWDLLLALMAVPVVSLPSITEQDDSYVDVKTRPETAWAAFVRFRSNQNCHVLSHRLVFCRVTVADCT